MFKERLCKEQPIAYKILENALISEHYAHAYLLVGEKGTPKKETAILLAQSLLCDEKGFACEVCNTCQRIAEHNYADFIFVDGEKTSIKKQDILGIQEEFNKTSVEAKGKKIYVLHYAENATLDALNSLLKFLEEPVQDVFAILTVEQLDRLLPTIQSRCQNIPLRKANVSTCYEYCMKENIDPLDAYLLSHLSGCWEEIVLKLEDENYQQARIMAMDTIQKLHISPDQALVHLQREGFKDKKGSDKLQFMMFLDILSIFFKDVIKGKTICASQSWLNAMKSYDAKDCIAYLSACMEAKDKCGRSVNLSLLCDQLIAKMKELKQ